VPKTAHCTRPDFLVERFAPGGIDLFRAFGIPGTSRISDINKSDGAMTFDDPAACLKCITENAHPPAVGAGRQSPLFESAWSHAEACLMGARGSHA
jgi:hypothetical protein